MAKNKLHEELFNYLAEKPAAPELQRIAEEVARSAAQIPPQSAWLAIQQKIRETPEPTRSFADTLKALFSPPLVPALALGVVGIMVGAFLLLNTGTSPHQIPLVELTAIIPQKAGDSIVAKGMRIENTGGGSISHVSGATDKILLSSGAWKMNLQHSELEKPVQFIFPGGALEPLGTAFTIDIRKEGTAVNLTEGKIRLYKFETATQKWQSSKMTAPFTGTLTGAPGAPEVPLDAIATPPVTEEKRNVPVSRYAAYVGSDISVELKNGDRLSGKLRAATGGKLKLVSASGTLTIRETDVEKINRN